MIPRREILLEVDWYFTFWTRVRVALSIAADAESSVGARGRFEFLGPWWEKLSRMSYGSPAMAK